ncbi:hypothetical protein LHJ74_32355 [Streptomyces sp. N2-109]|uniref:Chromosome segregation ATPase n=1 Tax=Streptomyces gossypii TaxID=2883101 RepID=A0ABT2K326_9ACTN|nr:hypothetical protein [Streptomyces gossypii]MCT2594548.1 hypothetical protein [Streptomyces gossypii]
MYELSRIRLYSIGPAGARYADTVLDLRGVGEPVPSPAPTQADFFEEEATGPPRRPAPAGVLFLENGGGKSVLLKLIFSVMLPGHRNTLGGASSGVLRKFLLADDCGHVALEWQHTRTGETVVVGKVSEWRGRQVSGDPRKFAEAWYAFRPGPGMSLDSLPVAESAALRPAVEGASAARGRRRTMKGFRDVLTETGKAYPNLDVHWEEIQERWNEHLTGLGLDPELFRYQREMNADEGEAAGLFAVKNDSDFTDLLLRAVTDTRDTDGLADLVHGFAHKLGRRFELTAERDFTAGSLDLLLRITEAADSRARTRDIHAGAERRTRTLARRLGARGAQERERAAELAEQLATADGAVAAADESRSRAALVAAELAYRHASLALAAAEKAAAGQRRELIEARTLHSAWQTAETVLRHRAATDRAARVAAAIREAERDAAPALAARAEAAAALVRALHTAAAEGERAAAEQEEHSAVLQARSEEAHRDATAAATEAQRARSEGDHLRERLAEVEQETAEAVRAGWLDATALDADPARAALAAGDAEKSAAAAWDTAREAARRAADQAQEAGAEHSRAELSAARAADAAEAARSAYAAEHGAACALGAELRLAELLGLPHASAPEATGDASAERALTAEELDGYADELRTLLDDSVATSERRLFTLRTAAADDSRMLGALGDGGLLPPGPDVLATVEYLGEHGIPALPGWRYLAQAVDPADHSAMLAARPELVDGVVITDPASHQRAREVLGAAALLPRSAVAVGTAAALLAPTPAPGTEERAVFLVPPNPAMHDERAADEERHQLRRRALDRDEEIRALAVRLADDRTLAARLASWRTGCPPGRLGELAATAERASSAAVEAEESLAEARTAFEEARQAAAETAEVRDERQERARHATRSADALAGLAFRLRERAGWQARLRELADERAVPEARAAACLERARAADEDRRAAQRAADDARRTARALRAERAEIAGVPDGAGTTDSTGTADPGSAGPGTADPGSAGPGTADPGASPSASLPDLREAYRSASQLYEKVGVGADLRAEQARAESDESAALATLDRLTNKVRTRAAQLLEGPEGADGPSRQAAASRSEALVQMLETRASAASEQLGRLRGEAERLAPADAAHTDLPPELVPADAEQAQTLLRTANAELAARRAELESAREARDGLRQAHHAAGEAAGAFEDTAALLSDLLREPQHSAAETESPEPYPGSAGEAGRAAAESRRSLRGCAADLTAAEQAVREASDVLVRHANATRYEQVRTPARQQIRELPAAALPEHAGAWAEAFAPRLRVLTDELEQLERNRDSIVDRLRGLVESSTATLRAAQRLSRLPEGLGEWSGQEFVRIRFEEPDQATLTERLGEVIDEATRSAVRKNSDLRRDGMSLLLRGVGAALQPRGVSVEILKPDAVLRAERVPVGQMGDVFSGGQLLTAAIALYCTMAALRSNDRGHDRHRHAGTLFLDNPIGRANATYLLELQRAVADALGVQLLYTTGLFDTTALAEFPLVIRLRNDADLRAGLKYISVEEHLRPGLPVPETDGEPVHGEITATRMYRRPEEPSAPQPSVPPQSSVPAQDGPARRAASQRGPVEPR